MNASAAGSWPERYAILVGEVFPVEGAVHHPLFLCGMSACVDARVDTRNLAAMRDADPSSRARALFDMLVGRAEQGVGGEVKFEWPDGPDWLRKNLPIRHSLGGTGPQAAWVLAKLGARPVVALEDRHDLMLNQFPEGVFVVQNDEVVEASRARRRDSDVPETFIFEYTAGTRFGDVVPKRSSRIIVRFIDRGVQTDEDFNRVSTELARDAAAGLLSGLNDVAPARIEEATERTFDLARLWRSRGLKTIHFELAGYASKDALNHVLKKCRGSITSLGMSHSELLALEPSADKPAKAMALLSEALELDRVCVHADTWAASIVCGPPDRERRVLMAGNAVASARAAAGQPVPQIAISQPARFDPLPFEETLRFGKRSFVSCPAPYLEKPATTLGLGDSFTAGCLYVLGQG